MTCERCARERHEFDRGPRWCVDCERHFDTWSRRYASDIVWATLSGMVVVLGISVGVPLLGAPGAVAMVGVFAGFGTLIGVYRLKTRRRRAEFLATGDVPRAYLPSPRS